MGRVHELTSHQLRLATVCPNKPKAHVVKAVKPNTIEMDPNRLQLNFGTGGYNSNDRNYPASDGNVYPTTPSTFPQPVFKNQQSKSPNEYAQNQVQSPTGYGGPNPGYFVHPPFQAPYSQPQQVQYQGQYQQQHSPSSPQPSFQQQQRQGAYVTNDPTSGLAHQLSNQNLGGVQRQGSPFGRQPSPNQRPRTGGGTQPQQTYGNLLVPPVPTTNSQVQSSSTDEPPEKNPEKYSANVAKRGQGLHALVEAFFRENITRARDRNMR